MDISLAAIRQFLVDHYDDEEISRLCFDHFHELYQEFTGGMSVGRKARELVDYCRRRDRLPALLAVLERERPEPFRRIFGRRPEEATGRRVNLNTAATEALCQLPGIGPTLAAAIGDARPFAAVDDLLRVRGIGPRRLAALREWCTV
jgi:hypothetical protein